MHSSPVTVMKRLHMLYGQQKVRAQKWLEPVQKTHMQMSVAEMMGGYRASSVELDAPVLPA